MPLVRVVAIACLAVAVAGAQAQQPRPRGRTLGIPFPGKTGPHNAITDVAGIAVGHATIIEGEGQLVPGKGPIRTGVTAILPRPERELGSGLRRHIQPERQRRHDRHQLDQGIRVHGRPDPAHGHAQRRHGPRCGDPVAAEERPPVHLHLSYRGRDVRFPERRERRARESRARHSGARSARSRAQCRKARSAAARAWAATDSRAASAQRRKSCRTDRAAGPLGVLVQCNYGGDFRILGVPIGQEITDLGTCMCSMSRSREPGPAASACPTARWRRKSTPDELGSTTKAAARSS